MTNRGHRFPEQRGPWVPPPARSGPLQPLQAEAVSFKNVSRHSLKISSELKDSGDGSYVSPVVSHTQSQQVVAQVF